MLENQTNQTIQVPPNLPESNDLILHISLQLYNITDRQVYCMIHNSKPIV